MTPGRDGVPRSRARIVVPLGLLAAFLALLFILILGGFLFQFVAARADRRALPPPGRLLDVGGHHLHWIESGHGSPAVVFESGISASCLNWADVRRRVAAFARACAYDRAGLGWSDSGPKPRTLSSLTGNLHAVFQAAGVSSPCILVGHSFGGLLAQAYTILYPKQVAGLVLVDPLSVSDWLNPPPERLKMLDRGVRLARRGAILARLGLVRFALALLTRGARSMPKGIARLTSGRGESTISRLVGEVQKMPRETWPAIRAHWCLPKSFQSLAEALESLPAVSAEFTTLGALPPVPVTILSAAHSTPTHLAERDRIAQASPRGRHIVAQRSGHWIHLDEPELVIEAIRDMYERLQS